VESLTITLRGFFKFPNSYHNLRNFSDCASNWWHHLLRTGVF